MTSFLSIYQLPSKSNLPIKKVILCCLLFLNLSFNYAQTDTTFWFAVPEVTEAHGDRPVFLRVSTLQDSSIITISQPANGTFIPITDTIPPNSQRSYELTSYLDILESKPPNTALNYGLLLQATENVAAYYEVLGTSPVWGVVNSDLFVFKGRNSLGTSFFTPFQSNWYNQPGLEAWSSIDIIATEDNTEVIINLTNNGFGGISANQPDTIYLNRGQTYSIRAESNLGDRHLSGSTVTSNKPIAITVKDDSIYDSGAYDLAGDQIVPIELIGQEYAIIKSSGFQSTDRAYIVATEGNTNLYLNGSSTPFATLNTGQTYEHRLFNDIDHIYADAPVYVFHVTGFGRELGGALLPSIGECTGSPQVSFVRATPEGFKLNIIIESGYEGFFDLNGTNSVITASNFQTIPGTNNEWVYAGIELASNIIIPDSVFILKNDSADFHLGIMNGEANSVGFRYGYFSNFASSLELGNERFFCSADTVTINAGGGKDSYLWNTGDTTSTITVTDSGTYYVETQKGICIIRDTVKITWHPPVHKPLLYNDTASCISEELTIATDTGFVEYNWSNGTTNSTMTSDTSGTFTISVKNINGCENHDTINIIRYQLPTTNISHDQNPDMFCTDSMVTLDAGPGFINYLWNTGQSSQVITTNQNHSYWVEVTDTNDCKTIDSVDTDCSTYVVVPNVFTPNGDDINDNFFVIGLHPNKWKLTVYNRFGKRSYYHPTYDNSWNGEGLTDGIYFFLFEHLEDKAVHKGWVQILR